MHLNWRGPWHGVMLAHGDSGLTIASQVFAPRLPRPKNLSAGTGIALLELAGFTQISASTSGIADDQNMIEAGQVYARHVPLLPVVPPDDMQVQIAQRVHGSHPVRPDTFVAGTGISIPQTAGVKTISAITDDQAFIEPSQVFARHPVRPDDLTAGTGISITQAAGTKTIASTFVVEDSSLKVSERVFLPRTARPDDIVAGAGITITQTAGTKTVAIAVDDSSVVIAERAYFNYRPAPVVPVQWNPDKASVDTNETFTLKSGWSFVVVGDFTVTGSLIVQGAFGVL